MAFGGETAESYYDEGLTSSMKGDLDAAVKLFEKAIRMDNTMASAYHQLGKCYMRMGRQDKAIPLLVQVVNKKPNQAPPRLDLGFALLGQGKVEEARSHFSKAMAINPTNGKAQLGYAQASFADGDWAQAAADAQSSLAVGGSNFPVQYLLGRASKLAGNLQLAESSLKKADGILEKTAEVDPSKPEPHFLRGEVAFVQEHFPQSIEHYNKAIGNAQPNRVYSAYGENFTLADVLAKKGLCLQRLGQHEEARKIGDQIATISPDHRLGKSLREG